MKKTVTPCDLFFDQLRELYSVECQLGFSLAKLAAKATHAGLRGLLLHHAEETEHQRVQLSRILAGHGLQAGPEKCKAMEGLIAAADAQLSKSEDLRTRDLAIIAHCLRVENYEISAYGIASRLAGRLGMTVEAGVLSSILCEEDFAMKSLRELECQVFELARRTTRPASRQLATAI